MTLNPEQKEMIFYAKEMGRRIAYHGIYNVSFKDDSDIQGMISLISLNYLQTNNYSNKTSEEKVLLQKELFSSIVNAATRMNNSLESKVNCTNERDKNER